MLIGPPYLALLCPADEALAVVGVAADQQHAAGAVVVVVQREQADSTLLLLVVLVMVERPGGSGLLLGLRGDRRLASSP